MLADILKQYDLLKEDLEEAKREMNADEMALQAAQNKVYESRVVHAHKFDALNAFLAEHHNTILNKEK